MNPRVRSKTISVSEREYRLDKPDARTACWIFNFLGAKIVDGGSVFTSLGRCTHAEFDEIQSIALRHTFLIDKSNENSFPIGVVGPNGVFADKELGDSSYDLMEVTSKWIEMVMEPFTVGSGSNSQKSQPPTSNQQST